MYCIIESCRVCAGVTYSWNRNILKLIPGIKCFFVRRRLERWFRSSCIWTKYFLHGMLTCDIWSSLGSGLWILCWMISWKLSIGLHYSVTGNGNIMCCAVERLIYYLHKIVWKIGKYQCFWLQKQIKDVTTSEYAAENSYKGFFLFPSSSVKSKV